MRGAADMYLDRIQARPRGYEKRLSILAAEAEIRRGFGDGDPLDEFSIGREYLHAVAGAGPDLAFFVAADAVGDAFVDDAEHFAAGEGAVVFHVKDADVMGL